MTVQPYHLYIERIDPSKNMARFYALSIEPNLFGGTSLVRSWGRIGSRGQQKIHVFDSEVKAVDLLLTLLRR
ncbi:WGR domain-containing protein, partial [Rhizobium johnstonii]